MLPCIRTNASKDRQADRCTIQPVDIREVFNFIDDYLRDNVFGATAIR